MRVTGRNRLHQPRRHMIILRAMTAASVCMASIAVEAASFTGLGDLPGGFFSSQASNVSGDGSVIVGVGSTASGASAFYWTESGGMQNLTDLLVSSFGLDLTGWTLTDASGVSADRLVVVGSGLNPLGQSEAWMADLRPVPAPAAVWLLGSSLIWLRTLGRRRSTGSFR